MPVKREISFADAQIKGPYAFARYAHEIRLLAPNDFVLKNVAEKGDKALLRHHANSTMNEIGQFLLDMTSDEVNTLDPALWIRVASAIRAANRVAAYAHIGVIDSSAIEPIADVAQVITILGNLCDEATNKERGIDGLIDQTTTQDIMTTLACGMGAFWLEWALNMGQLVSVLANEDLSERMLATRNRTLENLAQSEGISLRQAEAIVTACSRSFDHLQRASFADSPITPDKASLPPAVLHPKTAASQANALRSRKRPETSKKVLAAWCAVAMTSPTDCVIG